MKQGNHGNSHGHKEPNTGEGKDRNLHNPIEDRLIPLEPLDLSKVHSIDGLVRAMAKTAFTGRQLGEAADVLEAMALDEDAFIVMTLAGAMTVAKQGLIITEFVFQWPGMGLFFIKAIGQGDYPQVLAWVMIVVTSVIIFNLIVDIAYAVLDPRIRYA